MAVNHTMQGLYQVMLNQVGYKVHKGLRRAHAAVLAEFGDEPEGDPNNDRSGQSQVRLVTKAVSSVYAVCACRGLREVFGLIDV